MRLTASLSRVRSWLACAYSASLAACAWTESEPSLLLQARKAVFDVRFTSGRLSEQPWHACLATDTAALIPRSRCGPPLDPSAPGFAAYARAAAASRAGSGDSTAGGLFAAGILGLRASQDSRAGLDRAVASLEHARVRAPSNAAILNDLAAAYLTVAERDQQLMPMLRALDAVNAALARDTTYAPARYNRALILQRLFLVGSAAKAWSAYIAGERDDRWKAEARAHLRAVGDCRTRCPSVSHPTRAPSVFLVARSVGRGDQSTAIV